MKRSRSTSLPTRYLLKSFNYNRSITAYSYWIRQEVRLFAFLDDEAVTFHKCCHNTAERSSTTSGATKSNLTAKSNRTSRATQHFRLGRNFRETWVSTSGSSRQTPLIVTSTQSWTLVPRQDGGMCPPRAYAKSPAYLSGCIGFTVSARANPTDTYRRGDHNICANVQPVRI